ncbi:hypothetical protein [Agromyces humi]|uniref:hypothetical protein n=1 Tax=Agromyces humi TaxID=1766800 RepID=UPI00135787CC|nr:hypothetical protein [Agromyces humi]
MPLESIDLPFNDAVKAELARVPDGSPRAGELWGAGADGQVQAIVLVTAELNGFYLAIPVVPATGWATEQELVMPESILGMEATIVLAAESGLHESLLTRRFTTAATAAEIVDVRAAAHDPDRQTVFPRGSGEDDEDAVEWRRITVARFRDLAFS